MATKILLVDDSSADNYINSRVIERSGVPYALQSFDDPEKALEFLANCNEDEVPDILFLDINMPKLTGWELLEKIKERRIIPPPRVIILSTSDNPSDHHRALETREIEAYIVKPLKSEQVQRLVA